MSKQDGDTRKRLLRAATELFAATGFHGAKIRDIAERAGANVAAANYHFGSKAALYLDVLRSQFGDIRGRLTARAGLPSEERLARLPRSELVALMHARLTTMLDILIGPQAGVWGRLMQREMADPSEALPHIVEEFMKPQMAEMRLVLTHLFPTLPAAEVDRCVFSMIGQSLFYQTMRPAVLRFLGREEYPRGFARQVADHVLEFSLGGMERLAAQGGSRRAS
ncbi:MAG: DUF1956 domain-containing protein [Deltaproteobacteria bacterium]|nr:DUF1956 domain-containing protein [Deltaproteobacteria bacterium]